MNKLYSVVMKSMPELLIFDVNETLLSLEPIKNAINEKMDSIWAGA